MTRTLGRSGVLSSFLSAVLLVSISGCNPGTGGGVHGSVYTVVGRIVPPSVKIEQQVFLPDIEVFLHNVAKNTDSAPVKTDFFGRYMFPRQEPGKYELRWNTQLGWAAGKHPDPIVIVSNTRFPTPARVAAGQDRGVVSGRVTFSDGSSPWNSDELFSVNDSATVTVLNAARTATLGGPVHANALGYYAAAGIPRGEDLTVRSQSESASVSRSASANAVSFGSGAAPPVDVELPNQRPEIVSVYPEIGGAVIKTAAPGQVITLTSVTRDGNGDPLTHSWRALSGHGTIGAAGSSTQWTLPGAVGVHTAYLQVADGRGGYARQRVDFNVGRTHVTFSGRAVDKSSNAPVPGAAVTVNGTTATTDGNGFFRLKVPLADRYVMNIDKRGFALFSRVVPVELTGQTWRLVRAQSQVVDPTQPISVSDNRPELERLKIRGMRVRVPANALVDSNGAPPSGPLTVLLATLNIADAEAPGDWGARMGATETNLISYGAGFVQFVDSGGTIYNLRPGVSAEVELSAPSSMIPTAPSSTRTWSYDETTGFWQVNGSSTFVAASGSYVNKVSHFSTINTDLEKDQASCLGVLIYPPIPTGVKLRVTDPTGAIFGQSFEFVLNAAINAVYRLPANTDVKLELLNADGSPYGSTVLLEEVQGVTLPANVVNTGPPIPAGQDLWPPEPYVPPCKLVILREANEPTANVFLTFKQIGSLDQANAYYAAVDPNAERETLGEWWVANGFQFPDVNGNGVLDGPDFGQPPTNAVRTSYLNNNDLGSGRDMYFKGNSDGTAAAYVTNYGQFNQDHANADLAANRDTPGATVCMEYATVAGQGATRIVKFFVFAGADFGPNAPRQPSANLDGFGEKFVPNLCLNCHGGSYSPPATGPTFTDVNMGSSFRELDIATYKFPGGRLTANAAEKAVFKQQNEVVRGASNSTISVKGIKDLISGWYPGASADQDNSFTPPGWAGNPRQALYHDIVKASCRTCHVALGPGTGDEFDVDWTTYDQLKNRRGFLKSFVLCEDRFMPHAVITYRNFWLSGSPHRPAVLRTFQDGSNWAQLGPCQ